LPFPPVGAALENFLLEKKKNLFGSKYTAKIVCAGCADWAISQLPLLPILSNTMFIEINPRGKEFARMIPQACGVGNVDAWGPHLCVQLPHQNHKFATPGGEKSPTEHTTIKAMMINLPRSSMEVTPPISDTFPPHPRLHRDPPMPSTFDDTGGVLLSII
jgi:hypothetical protein